MLNSAWCLVMAQIQFSLMQKRLDVQSTCYPPLPYILIFALTPHPRQSGRHICITP